MQINYLILILAEKGTNLFLFKRQTLAKKILRERDRDRDRDRETQRDTERDRERTESVVLNKTEAPLLGVP